MPIAPPLPPPPPPPPPDDEAVGAQQPPSPPPKATAAPNPDEVPTVAFGGSAGSPSAAARLCPDLEVKTPPTGMRPAPGGWKAPPKGLPAPESKQLMRVPGAKGVSSFASHAEMKALSVQNPTATPPATQVPVKVPPMGALQQKAAPEAVRPPASKDVRLDPDLAPSKAPGEGSATGADTRSDFRVAQGPARGHPQQVASSAKAKPVAEIARWKRPKAKVGGGAGPAVPEPTGPIPPGTTASPPVGPQDDANPFEGMTAGVSTTPENWDRFQWGEATQQLELLDRDRVPGHGSRAASFRARRGIQYRVWTPREVQRVSPQQYGRHEVWPDRYPIPLARKQDDLWGMWELQEYIRCPSNGLPALVFPSRQIHNSFCRQFSDNCGQCRAGVNCKSWHVGMTPCPRFPPDEAMDWRTHAPLRNFTSFQDFGGQGNPIPFFWTIVCLDRQGWGDMIPPEYWPSEEHPQGKFYVVGELDPTWSDFLQGQTQRPQGFRVTGVRKYKMVHGKVVDAFDAPGIFGGGADPAEETTDDFLTEAERQRATEGVDIQALAA